MNKGRLSGLENTRESGNVHPYSRFIKFFKIIMPLGVIGIIGLLFLWPELKNIEPTVMNQQDIEALQQAKKENTLIKPVFNTQDSQGRPISITASDARQQRDNADAVTLTAPRASLRDDQSEYKVQAESGFYDKKNKKLILQNTVILEDNDGSRLETNDLTTDINNNISASKSPATLTTDTGTISGQSITIDRDKQITTFQGPAKAVINPK